MIHECNRALESVWSAAAAGARMPAPDPAPGALDHAFVARRWDADHYAFTHVGPGLSAIHGRRLLEQNLLGLWTRADRIAVRDALADAMRLATPLIVRTRGRLMDGGSIAFEGTFWPMEGPHAAVDRVLGALAPCVGGLGGRPVIEHAVDEIALMPRTRGEHAPRSQELARLLAASIIR
jgi:hypothetical protein